MSVSSHSTRPAGTKVRPHPLGAGEATVSVVIPCFNYGRFLSDAVLSALNQDAVRVEIIIVDDASTDDSAACARKLQWEHSNIRFIGHEHNEGAVSTFNDGARRASGEYLVRLDADDVLTPGSLARSVAVMEHFPSVGLVYGHPIHFSGTIPSKWRETPSAWTVWPGEEWLEGRCRQGVNVITSPEVLMRRSIVDRIGYQAPLCHTHDMEHWLRIAAFSDVAYIHGADQAFHREHAQSLSAREVDKFTDLRERLAAFETLSRNIQSAPLHRCDLLQVARRSLARQALDFAAQDAEGGRGDVASAAAHMAFAVDVCEGARDLHEWAALQARLAWPRQLRPYRFFLSRLRRRMYSEVCRRRWHGTGVY
jgi:glycosyltransferase involved in cell wall biosynthesis